MLMKKLFTSMLLMAAAVVASAQNFTVTAFDGAQTLKDGDVIECGYTIDEIREWNPKVEVLCNKNLTLTVTANAPAGHKIMFCGITGICKMLDGTPETRSNVYPAGSKIDMQCDIKDMFGDVELVEPVDATLKITDGTETVNITITFVPESQEELSISNVAAKGTAISVQGRTLYFNTDTTADLTLYTISGQAAISRRISGQGSLNLSQLPAGVYIYRAGKKTGKLILR